MSVIPRNAITVPIHHAEIVLRISIPRGQLTEQDRLSRGVGDDIDMVLAEALPQG
jgi:hypothetical protein